MMDFSDFKFSDEAGEKALALMLEAENDRRKENYDELRVKLKELFAVAADDVNDKGDYETAAVFRIVTEWIDSMPVRVLCQIVRTMMESLNGSMRNHLLG